MAAPRPGRSRLSGPRRSASRIIAGACLVIAVAMPAMEVVPFSANLAGIVLLAFGLALVGFDGLVALVGVVVTVAALVLTIGHFL
ncbi:MAG TPA: exopolysaccharide biosynthesis protein [Thermoanaerobaculia bacterium]|nr:exopolysaccharide biosynthesis protein [Thermoanaerobaculia bacterium]